MPSDTIIFDECQQTKIMIGDYRKQNNILETAVRNMKLQDTQSARMQT